MPATPIDPTGGLLSYGVLGILVALLLTGIIVPGYLYKRTESENDRLRRLIDDKVYPLVDKSVNAVEQCIDLLKDLSLGVHDLRSHTEAMRELPNITREVHEMREELRRKTGR